MLQKLAKLVDSLHVDPAHEALTRARDSNQTGVLQFLEVVGNRGPRQAHFATGPGKTARNALAEIIFRVLAIDLPRAQHAKDLQALRIREGLETSGEGFLFHCSKVIEQLAVVKPVCAQAQPQHPTAVNALAPCNPVRSAMSSEDQALFIAAENLCVGMYVFIDLPWFRHPFSFNHFKIRSPDQIATLRSLGVKQFRIDPAKSDVKNLPATVSAPDVVESSAPLDESSTDPETLVKNARVTRLKERREKMGQVEKAFAKAAGIMRNINRNLLSRSRECLEEVGELVDQMVIAFLESPELTLHVMGEKAGGEEVYYHGLNTSILSMMLAKDLGINLEQGRLLGLGALLHDIGLMDIPDRVLKKTDELTHAENELRKMHCEYGLRIGQKIGLPEAVLAIIYQHHEMADGSGYPKALKSAATHPLARIISVVNYYDNLCNPTDLAKALTPHEALSLMFAQRRSKFDAQTLQLLIRSLGVFPPGTIVKLSNDALGLVQSVNPQKPLRPWILLYDPEIPKEEAVMVDLEREPDLNISKAIRPIQLPATVYDYLSPRKRVTYYFDGDSAGKAGGS